MHLLWVALMIFWKKHWVYLIKILKINGRFSAEIKGWKRDKKNEINANVYTMVFCLSIEFWKHAKFAEFIIIAR